MYWGAYLILEVAGVFYSMTNTWNITWSSKSGDVYECTGLWVWGLACWSSQGKSGMKEWKGNMDGLYEL